MLITMLKGLTPIKEGVGEMNKQNKRMIRLVNCEVPVGEPIIIKEIAPQRWGYSYYEDHEEAK